VPRYRKQKEEYRDHLYDARAIFEDAERTVTSEWISNLTRAVREQQTELTQTGLGCTGYAWAVERQSLGAVALGDPNHTGHIARVQTILRLATQHRLALLAPVERVDRREGEPPYIFDPRVWYVDGEDERSSGFTQSPEVRPRLWALYAVLRQINRIDPSARPSAIIIADEVRFMRADHAIKEWYRALKHEGVDLIFPESGRVLADSLDILGMKVRVASAHLQYYAAQAREIARQQGRVPWGKAPTGTRWEDKGRRLVADPDWWPKLADCVARLASGEIPSLRAVPTYLKQTYGDDYVLTTAGFYQLLKREHIFDGYHVSFDRKCEPCIVRERHGHRFDFSYTEGRQKRYLHVATPEETWVRKEVEHRYGTEPIPPLLLEEARRRTSVRGRPSKRTDEEARWQVAPPYMIRCAYPGCGATVRERPGLPPEKKAGKHGIACEWGVSCELDKRYVGQNGMTTEEFRQMVIDQGLTHKRVALGSLSYPLIALLREKLFDPSLILPSDVSDGTEHLDQKKHELELEREKVARKVRVQTLSLEDADPDEEPDVYNSIRTRLRELQGEMKEIDRELNRLSAETLNRAEVQRSLAEAREAFLEMLEVRGDDPEFWKAIVRTFVEVIHVDLTTGRFVAEVRLDVPELRELVGELENPPSDKFITPRMFKLSARAWSFVLEGKLMAA